MRWRFFVKDLRVCVKKPAHSPLGVTAKAEEERLP